MNLTLLLRKTNLSHGNFARYSLSNFEEKLTEYLLIECGTRKLYCYSSLWCFWQNNRNCFKSTWLKWHPYSISFESRSMIKQKLDILPEKRTPSHPPCFHQVRHYSWADMLLLYWPPIFNNLANSESSLSSCLSLARISWKLWLWNQVLPWRKQSCCRCSLRLKDSPPLHAPDSSKSLSSVQLQIHDPFLDQIKDALPQDFFAQTVFSSLNAQNNAVINKSYSVWKNFLLFEDRLYVPKTLRKTVMKWSHDSCSVSHPGFE